MRFSVLQVTDKLINKKAQMWTEQFENTAIFVK